MTILTADEIFEQAHGVIFAGLGVTATYTPTVGAPETVRVIVDRNVFRAPPGLDGYAVEPRTEISVIKATISGLPGHGSQMTVGAETWRVDERLEDDGIVIRLAVSPT